MARPVSVLICPVCGGQSGVNHWRIAALLLQWPALGHCYWWQHNTSQISGILPHSVTNTTHHRIRVPRRGFRQHAECILNSPDSDIILASDLCDHGLHPAPPPLRGQADVCAASEEEDGLRKDGDLYTLEICPEICYLWRPNIKCPGMNC